MSLWMRDAGYMHGRVSICAFLVDTLHGAHGAGIVFTEKYFLPFCIRWMRASMLARLGVVSTSQSHSTQLEVGTLGPVGGRMLGSSAGVGSPRKEGGFAVEEAKGDWVVVIVKGEDRVVDG